MLKCKKVIKIEEVGEQSVYDICDVFPNNNFIANNIVSHNCLMLDEEISQCLSYDTKVRTASGDMSIETLFKISRMRNSVVKVYSYKFFDREMVEKEANVLFSGKKVLKKLLFDDGSFVKCSNDHRFFMRDGLVKKSAEISVGDEVAFVEAEASGR